jgi:alpha-ketoglutarate-dependent taurine dioxygenase
MPISVIEATKSRDYREIPPSDILGKLASSGAVLLRGFNFDLENFEAFTRIFCDGFHIPATRAARRPPKGDSYSTEVFQNNYSLLGHTEGTYKPYPAPPEICFFMCVTPPVEPGGETTVVDGVEFLNRLPASLRRRFEDSGLTYEMYWEKERWQNEFEVENIRELEALLASLSNVRYAVHGDALHLFYTRQAIQQSRQGDRVFATALLAHLPHIAHPLYYDKKAYCKPSNRVFFGDGEELTDETVNELIDIHDSLAYPHRWAAQDVLVLDNTRYLHGRTMTARDCARVLVSRFGWFKEN